MKKIKLLKIFIIILVALAITLPVEAKSPPQKTSLSEEISLPTTETVEVLKVIDGDTLKVKYRGHKENVRLIGIDAPESRINKKALRDAKRSTKDIKIILQQGREATKYVKTLVKPGETVRLEFDVQPRDRYSRLLNYVYLDNDKMLNEEIVRAGYAGLMTIPPNVKYEQKLLQAYREAREMKRGLWGEN